MVRHRLFFLLSAFALGAPFIVTAAHAQEERFGDVHFPISCSADAQTQFNRAVAMLHSFFFPETVKAFTAIAKQEPTCAMAHWGVAISQRPNPLVGPFPGDVLKAGWEAIEKARGAPQQTQRKRESLEARAAYYKDNQTVPQKTRTANYEAAMARLSTRFPNEVEATIFYALALNEATDPSDKTYAKPLKAAEILERLGSQHPNHPGIPHYIIHSYDYPELAIRGVIAANRCAQLAPSAPHALHMPSHIYSTLGMWREVINADLASDEMTKTYAARVNPQIAGAQAKNAGRYHSLDFLINAYLQLAQDAKAKAILETRNSLDDGELPASIRTSMHTAYAAIPVRYAFERGAWREAATLPVARTVYPQAEAISWFGRAVGGARSDDLASARQALQQLGSLKEKLAKANDEYWAGQL